MKKNQSEKSRFISCACFVLLAGFLITSLLIKQSNISRYPATITKIYKEKQHYLTVPGSTEVKLTRTGAYGIYFEQYLPSSIYPDVETPPKINCTLTSKATGATIEGVPDYIETNRYISKDLQTGVLIMSITIDQPGAYTFACCYQNGRNEPEFQVSLGPNYFWEFLNLIWKIGLPILGGTSIMCGSILFAFLFVIAGLVFEVCRMKNYSPQH